MGGRDHSCEGCGLGGFNNDDPCECPRRAFGVDLQSRICLLNDDEFAVIEDALDHLLTGLERGRDQYGPLDLRGRLGDRDFQREANEELRDGMLYQAMDRVRRDRRGK